MIATIEERTRICVYYCKKYPRLMHYVFRGELVLVIKTHGGYYLTFFGSSTTFKIFGIRELRMLDGKVTAHRILRDEEVRDTYKALKTFKLL